MRNPLGRGPFGDEYDRFSVAAVLFVIVVLWWLAQRG